MAQRGLVTVAHAFMAKKTASMQRVLSPEGQHSVDDALEDEGMGPEGRVRFEPFEFEEEQQKEVQVILHKLSEDIMFQDERAESNARIEHLRAYLAKHPNTLVIDPIEAVQRVISRTSSCEILSNLHTTHPGAPFRGPRWFLAESVEEAKSLLASGTFSYPVICKPVAACGIPESHLMTVAVDESGLALAPMPCVVQEYTNHGGLLHKVYVLGDEVMVYHRKSLPDLPSDASQSILFDSQQTYPTLEDFVTTPPKASTAKGKQQAEQPTLRENGAGRNGQNVAHNESEGHQVVLNDELATLSTKTPVTPRDSRTLPMETYTAAATILSDAFGLSLLGFDIIVCEHTDDIVVIDVNYFPSYKEVEDFPDRLKRFILKTLRQRTSS